MVSIIMKSIYFRHKLCPNILIEADEVNDINSQIHPITTISIVKNNVENYYAFPKELDTYVYYHLNPVRSNYVATLYTDRKSITFYKKILDSKLCRKLFPNGEAFKGGWLIESE